MKIFFYLLFIVSCWGCTHISEKKKSQGKRNIIINVRDKIRPIMNDDILIGSITPLYIVNDYLIIGDIMSLDKSIHVFDKNNFEYVTSFGNIGEGPDEITYLGHIAADEKNRMLYVTDLRKYKISKYPLDSVITNPQYLAIEKITINPSEMKENYCFINDILCVGTVTEPIGNADFRPVVAKWNLSTGNNSNCN